MVQIDTELFEHQIPLVCDLDDTLIKTDTLWEGVCSMLHSRPSALLGALLRLREGRLAFKEYVSPYTLETIAHLPINQPVFDYCAQAIQQGRKLYLATASPRAVAEALAARLGGSLPFERIFASEGCINLSGEAKATLLLREFPDGFDYIGDSRTDVPVWRAARKAIVAGASPAVLAAAQGANTSCEVLEPARPPCVYTYAKALRVHQWIKNLLLFVPPILAHQAGNLGSILLAFVSMCCCASSIYVLNDICDLDADRSHARKKARPFASGAISLRLAPVMLAVTAGLAVFPCLLLPGAFSVCLLLYIVLTVSYSLVLKRLLLVDVLVLAMFYILRLAAGSAVLGIPPSNWLISFAAFIFLGLGLLKRVGELGIRQSKLPGRAYQSEDKPLLEAMALCSGFTSFVVFTLYIDSLQAIELYKHPVVLWGMCPVLVYWYGRIAILAHRGIMHDDPISFAIRDKVSLTIVALVCVLFYWAL